ncbi:MAG: 4-hydroxythreonine-4-phosphate dehydrogenase PdxA [Ignavibacteriae bacterium]|nr:4-hydroxythreonine-4-phosphate dehydrogenase PdxA [Ignavibacteriota bacterium]
MKQRILITCGDINGIGPELALRVFNDKNLLNQFDIKIIGPIQIFEYYSKLLKLKKISEKNLLDLPAYNDINIKTGEVNAVAGRISGDAIKLGVDLCLKKYFDALVTLPINKESLNLGGYNYRGHTEMLSHLTSSKNTFMLMYSSKLKIVPVTIHIPVKKTPSSISKTKLIEKIININNTFVKTFKIKKPRIAVLALNPHCGDGGLIGYEEKKIISPAIAVLLKAGFNIKGPFSADGFFGNNEYKKFDATVSMYHDQAMIPFKMLSKDSGVNFTGGLRIIRTSPAHGTAYDIAGKGVANITSTLEAIKLAGKLSAIY